MEVGKVGKEATLWAFTSQANQTARASANLKAEPV